MKTSNELAKFAEWWADFQINHEEWKFADREALLLAAYQAGLAAAPTPPAQEAEPVAVSILGELAYLPHKKKLPHGTEVYTRPDTSELRKAAEEVLEAFKQNASRHPVTPALLNAISSLSRVTESAKTDE